MDRRLNPISEWAGRIVVICLFVLAGLAVASGHWHLSIGIVAPIAIVMVLVLFLSVRVFWTALEEEHKQRGIDDGSHR
jgi:hypothetical protein